MSGRVAELQVLLEGVALPASKQELLRHASRQGADAGSQALLEALPEREYGTIDEVGETLQPVQPPTPRPQPERPEAESGPPPGGEAYTEASGEPGAVRERGPES